MNNVPFDRSLQRVNEATKGLRLGQELSDTDRLAKLESVITNAEKLIQQARNAGKSILNKSSDARKKKSRYPHITKESK